MPEEANPGEEFYWLFKLLTCIEADYISSAYCCGLVYVRHHHFWQSAVSDEHLDILPSAAPDFDLFDNFRQLIR